MEDKSIIIVVALIVFGITTTICGGMYLYNLRAEAAFKAGLEEGVIPGQQGVHWIRSK